MTAWRHYAKMIPLENYLAPVALTIIGLALILVFRLFASSQNLAPQLACAFSEAALPLLTALIGNSLFFGDPALELNYTLSRPFWRSLLERNVMLLFVMTLFYLVFSLMMGVLGITMAGWSSSGLAILVWLTPAMAWLGVIFLLSALMGSATGGSSLTALLWLACFFLNGVLRNSPVGQALFPLLTIFEADSPTWPLNRLALALLGLSSFGLALLLLRNSEKYLGSEKG